MRTKIVLICAAILTMAAMLGGCMMEEVKEMPNIPQLPEVEGLKLPDERQLLLFNGKDEKYTIYPFNYDFVTAEEKGLFENGGYNSTFFFTQALYRKVLEEHLEAELGLVAYDEEIRNSGIDMMPVPPEEQYYYQYCESLPMQYIYLRNNIYVERLSDKDLAVIKKHYEALDATVTPELKEIVERTYPGIICLSEKGKGDAYQNYDPGGGDTANDRALVFEIRRNDDGSKYSNDELREQALYLITIREKMQEELDGKIENVPITIFFDNF